MFLGVCRASIQDKEPFFQIIIKKKKKKSNLKMKRRNQVINYVKGARLSIRGANQSQLSPPPPHLVVVLIVQSPPESWSFIRGTDRSTALLSHQRCGRTVPINIKPNQVQNLNQFCFKTLLRLFLLLFTVGWHAEGVKTVFGWVSPCIRPQPQNLPSRYS